MIINIKEYIRLMRLHQPTGFLLLFWPCSFGILLANPEKFPWNILLVFLIGSIAMRSAGCIINDIVDKDLDKYVKRTKVRPIASGKVSTKEAIFLLIPLLFIGAVVLFSLNATAIYIGLFSISLVIIYPFMKRITNYPQVFLAITFNIGALIGYTSSSGKIQWDVVILYISCFFWTLGYDTIYGFQDIKCDRKIGIKSTSLTFEKYGKIFLYLNYLAMSVFLFIVITINEYSLKSHIILYVTTLCSLFLIYRLDQNSPKQCMHLFKRNNYLGIMVFLLFILK